MAKFIFSFKRTLASEGGYVNDQKDLGGETYKGISRNYHYYWDGWKLIDSHKSNSDFPKSLDADLTLQNKIEQFYYVNFWSLLNLDKVTDQFIADSIFDFSINAGIITSVRLIQAIVQTKIDGIVGEHTLHKINSMDSAHLINAFTLEKIKYYISISQKRPANQKFLLGWINRALSFCN